MKKRENRRGGAGSWLDSTGYVLEGSGIAGLTGVSMLLVWAMLMAGGVLPESWLYALVLLSCMLGAAVGGRYAVKKSPERPLLKGIGVGGVFFLLLITAGLLVYDGVSVEQGGGGLLLAGIFGGGLASLPGGGGRKRRTRG